MIEFQSIEEYLSYLRSISDAGIFWWDPEIECISTKVPSGGIMFFLDMIPDAYCVGVDTDFEFVEVAMKVAGNKPQPVDKIRLTHRVGDNGKI